jgi:hypothetical protein
VDDPNSIGKALKGSAPCEFWKYRIGNCRIMRKHRRRNSANSRRPCRQSTFTSEKAAKSSGRAPRCWAGSDNAFTVQGLMTGTPTASNGCATGRDRKAVNLRDCRNLHVRRKLLFSPRMHDAATTHIERCRSTPPNSRPNAATCEPVHIRPRRTDRFFRNAVYLRLAASPVAGCMKLQRATDLVSKVANCNGRHLPTCVSPILMANERALQNDDT